MSDKKMIDYSPLLENEWLEAQQIVSEITTYIPEGRMESVWYLHNKILGTNERKPCKCSSSAKHWGRAVDTIREFVKRVNGQ